MNLPKKKKSLRVEEEHRIALAAKVGEIVESDPLTSGKLFGNQRIFRRDYFANRYRCFILLGGYRSSKTHGAASVITEDFTETGKQVYAVTTTQIQSRKVQQTYFDKFMPHWYKETGKYLYTPEGGFTNDMFSIRAKDGELTIVEHRFYMQQQDTIQGFDAHIVWHDEETALEDFKLYQARQITHGGKTVMSAISRKGMTPLLQVILGGATTIATRYAPLLRKELPVIQTSTAFGGCGIYYFWMTDNKYNDEDFVRDHIKGLTAEEVETEVYGIPKKLGGLFFPGFRPQVHIQKKDEEENTYRVHDIRESILLNGLDPHSARPWAIGWAWMKTGISENSYHVIREWPEFDYKTDASSGSRGFRDYIRSIKIIEKEILGPYSATRIIRLIDPKAGKAPQQGEFRTDTLQEILMGFDMHFKLAPVGNPGSIELGHELIRDALNLPNPFDDPGPNNKPRLTFEPICANFIKFIELYNKQDPDEWKDFCDILRFFLSFGQSFRGLPPESQKNEAMAASRRRKRAKLNWRR